MAIRARDSFGRRGVIASGIWISDKGRLAWGMARMPNRRFCPPVRCPMNGDTDSEPVAGAPPRPRRPGWQLAPPTYVLMAVNIAVYALMVLRGVSPTAPGPATSLIPHWGANVGLFVTARPSGVVAPRDFHLRPFRHHHIAHKHVVPLQPGIARRAIGGRLGVFVGISADWSGPEICSAWRCIRASTSAGQIVDPGVISVGASGAVFGHSRRIDSVAGIKAASREPRRGRPGCAAA